VTECSIPLREGGNYHIVFVTDDGTECSFRGTYLEVEPPTRTVATWLFDGWPDAEAVESVHLNEEAPALAGPPDLHPSRYEHLARLAQRPAARGKQGVARWQ
jgi:uncharacterized protein YndB with AHSA1/START domain